MEKRCGIENGDEDSSGTAVAIRSLPLMPRVAPLRSAPAQCPHALHPHATTPAHTTVANSPRRRHPARVPPPPPNRTRLAAELLVLFIALPGALAWARHAEIAIPIVPVVIVVALALLVPLLRDPTISLRAVLRRPATRPERNRMLGCCAVGLGLLTVTTWAFWPERLFDLPRREPVRWAVIMLAYPLLSVLPQELLFRVYFFHRYARLFSTERLRIVGSAVVFGWVHIAYGHWFSVALSTLGGLLFGITYARTGSLRLVWLEHALYGCWIFSVGLGQFFYSEG